MAIKPPARICLIEQAQLAGHCTVTTASSCTCGTKIIQVAINCAKFLWGRSQTVFSDKKRTPLGAHTVHQTKAEHVLVRGNTQLGGVMLPCLLT